MSLTTLIPVQSACLDILRQSNKEGYALVARARVADPIKQEAIAQERSRILSIQILFYEKLLTFVSIFMSAPQKEFDDIRLALDGCLFPDPLLAVGLKNTYIRHAGEEPGPVQQLLLDLMVKNSLLAHQILKAVTAHGEGEPPV